MIPILTAQQIRALDAHTITHEPITSIDLMERACRAFTGWFTQHFDATKKIGIVCGTGNNGGDGLGVARQLVDWGYSVTVWVVKGTGKPSIDFEKNAERLVKLISITEIKDIPHHDIFSGIDILIDAIFGSGLSRPAEGIYARVIECVNAANAVKVAIDVPSGLYVDSAANGQFVQATYTVSFQLPKLVFFLPQYYPAVGQWTIVDIGLRKDFVRAQKTSFYYLTKKYCKKLLRSRKTFDHKGSYGHALLIAGSLGKIGAALLSTRALLRTGVGLVTVQLPRCGYSVIQTSVPEAMVLVDKHEDFITRCVSIDHYTVVGIGPGLGMAPETCDAFAKLLETATRPLVIDADALNMLALDKTLLSRIPKGSILTPHPKEFERLVGSWENDFDRLKKQQELAHRLQAVIILKGAFTSIATPAGEVFFNSTGNPGMATAGSGDVLTGILTSLLAQGYPAREAAQLGVFIHGLAGDLAANEMGMNSLIASDIVSSLPRAFKRLMD